jgi:omega-6 fatty acid desaturase (delta-12 desaturase)
MPAPLEWATGYVGYHQLHHFSPKIPLYHLRACHLALGKSLPCQEISLKNLPRIITLALWSDELHRLVTFREAKALSH